MMENEEILRSTFYPKVGEIYPLRGGGVSEVVGEGLDGVFRLLAIMRQGGEVTPAVYTIHGKYANNVKGACDMMPVVPEKKYRPWTCEELEAFAKRDGWVRRTDDNALCRINRVRMLQNGDASCNTGGGTFSSNILLENYTQDDEAKTPCGEEIQ